MLYITGEFSQNFLEGAQLKTRNNRLYFNNNNNNTTIYKAP